MRTVTYRFEKTYHDIYDDFETHRKEVKTGRQKRVEKRAKIRKMKSSV